MAGDSRGRQPGGRRRPPAARQKPQLLIYPVTDAGVNTPSYAEFADGFGLTAAAMRRFWELYLDGADGLQPDASPLRAQDLDGLPPAYVLTAEPRRAARRGRGLRRRAERAGVPVTLDRRAGTLHGFWRWQTTAIARDAVREAGAAVRAALG